MEKLRKSLSQASPQLLDFNWTCFRSFVVVVKGHPVNPQNSSGLEKNELV